MATWETHRIIGFRVLEGIKTNTTLVGHFLFRKLATVVVTWVTFI